MLSSFAYLSHCYFTRLNLKKMGPLWFCLLALLGNYRHLMQKEFLKSYEGFLRAALTVHGHPGPVWKIAKMALFDPCLEFEIFLDQMTSFEVLFFDFNQKMSQAPSSSIQVLIWEDKLDYLNNTSQDFKNSFCLWFLWIFSNAGRQN